MATRSRTSKTQRDSPFLRKARDRFKLANEADASQAERERDDLSFYAGDQWPADIKNARQGRQPENGMPGVPARPTLVINKVREPVRQILNQERAADIGIELVPADDFGDLGVTPDDTEITLREGLVRRIQRESQAADARTWAFARAVQAGRGYYLVMTRFLPGKTWDQEIYLHRIYNQAGVLIDPSHEQPDGSDADWGFVGTWVPWERYGAEWPEFADGTKNPWSEYSEADFIAATEEYPNWYRETQSSDKDGTKQRAIRVVDYWYTERVSKTLAILEDGTALYLEEVPEGQKPADTRTQVEKQIKWAKIGGGVHVLEETDWNGPDMPIIKVLGEELQPYDHERRAEGMVRPMRDSGMGFNYMASKLTEQLGLSPIPLLQLDPEAIDGYEDWYKLLNTRALPYAPYRSFDDQGRQLNPPQRLAVDANVLPIAQAISMFDQAIQSTTAVSDPSLGRPDPSVKSAKHAGYLIAQSSQATSNFLDNLARSIRYEAQVINNLLYPIYGAKPGRLVRIMTGEGDPQQMLIDDPEQHAASQQLRAKALKVAKLTKDAHFNVAVKLAKDFPTRRAQEAAILAEMMSNNPELITWFGDLFFKNSDGPGHQAMSERAKVMLAPPIQQMLAAQEEGKEFDPAAQAQIAQLTERLKELEQIAGQMNDELKTKGVENKAKVEIATLQAQADAQKTDLEARRDLMIEQERAKTEIEKARMDNATKIHVAEIAAKTKGIIQAQEMEHEAIALAHTQQHEAEQTELDRENMDRQQSQSQAHEAALTVGGQEHATDEAERGRQATADENERNRQAQSEAEP